MAFQSVPNTVQASFNWAGPNNLTWSNHLAFQKVDFAYLDMVALAQNLADAAEESAVWSYMPTSVACTHVTVTDLREQFVPQAVYTCNGVGLVTQDMINPSLAVVVTLRTLLRGRSYRGRLYMGGWVEGEYDGTEFSQAAAAAALDFVAECEAAASPLGWDLGVISRIVNGAARPTGVFTEVTTYEVRSRRPGVQRRRVRRP